MVEKTYFLNLQTLFGYIQGRTAMLRTTLALARNRPGCQGIIFQLQANTLHCYIVSQAGELLFAGDEAQKRLMQSKEWLVRIDTESAIGQEWLTWLQQHNLTHLASAPAPQATIPRPKKPIEAAVLRQFTAQQALFLRTVYALINGQRTVDELKERLSQWPAQVIDEALRILYALGLIE